MANSFEQQTIQRRRWVGALLGAVLFHVVLGLLPLPRFSGSWGVLDGSGGGAARGFQESFLAGALRGMEVAILAPPPPAPVVPQEASASEPVPDLVPQSPESDVEAQEVPEPPTEPPRP